MKYATVLQVRQTMDYDLESELLMHLGRKKLKVRMYLFFVVTIAQFVDVGHSFCFLVCLCCVQLVTLIT